MYNIRTKPKINSILKMETIEQDIIGKRFWLKGEFGTVLYFGKLQVEKAGEENWYGVEWDNEKRGKHNGTVDGVCYFIPRHHPIEVNSCSFIREGRLPFGISLKEAIEKKYQAYKGLTEEEKK